MKIGLESSVCKKHFTHIFFFSCVVSPFRLQCKFFIFFITITFEANRLIWSVRRLYKTKFQRCIRKCLRRENNNNNTKYVWTKNPPQSAKTRTHSRRHINKKKKRNNQNLCCVFEQRERWWRKKKKVSSKR